MITIKYKGLSPKGRGKLQKLQSRIPKAAQVSLRKRFTPAKRAIISRAPSPGREKMLLSRGSYAGSDVGTPYGGRFFKAGTQRYVRDALSTERPVVGRSGNIIFLEWGNIANINSKIGFSWTVSQPSRGVSVTRQTSQSQFLWKNLIQAWEGDKFAYRVRVTARGYYPLQPEDGKYVYYVDKTIPPHHMVRDGYAHARSGYYTSVSDDIRKETQKIGLS